VAIYLAGEPEPFTSFAVEPFEVIDAMDPLSSSEKDDEFRIREEEAKAFARVVVFKIQERFNWLPLAKPSWYGVKEGVSREEEPPAPEAPKVAPPEAPKPAEPAKAPEPTAPSETPKAPEPAPEAPKG